MVVDEADTWEAKPDRAVRPSGSRAAPVKQGWPHRCVRSAARKRPCPPSPPFAACSQAAGGSGRRAFRGSGGGGAGFGWKRGLPPPKRRVVTSPRRFPRVFYGRESPALILRSGGEDGFRVGDSPSHGDFRSQEGGLLPAMLEKVVAANSRASVADWYPQGHKAMVGKASYAAVGNAGLMEISGAVRFFGARGDQLGKKLESLPAIGSLDALVTVDDNGSLSYGQSAETVGTMVNEDARDGDGQELEEGEIADTTEIAEVMIKIYDTSRPMEVEELEEGEIATTMDSVESINKDFLDGPVEGKLEKGEIAASATMDIVGVMVKEDSDGPSEGHELEEGVIATTMDIVVVTNKEDLDGSVEGQELEEGEIAPTMDIVEAMNEDTFDEAVEFQDFEEGVIVATRGAVESANKKALDGAVIVEECEEGEIATTMDIVEYMHNQALDGVTVVQGLVDSEIAGMDVLEGTDKDTFVRQAKDRELEGEIDAKEHGKELDDGEIAAKGYSQELDDGEISAKGRGQEPDDCEIAAKGHGQESGDGEIATESNRIVQQSVNVIPCGSTSGLMRSKIRLTARKTVRPPVIVNHVQELVTLDRPFSTTAATMKKFNVAQTKPVKQNHTMSQLVPLDRPLFTTSSTMKKFKATATKHAPINLASASASASASKEKHRFKYMFSSIEKLKGKRAVYLEDDDILKAVVVHEGKLELCLSVPSCVRSVWRPRQHGGWQNADPCRRVRMMCRRFEFLCRFLAQAVKQGSMELRRVDLAADQVIKKLPDYVKHRSTVGEIAGVEVGDEFLFRVELAIVGLHSPYRAGIDTAKDTDGELVAVSIVASGGYLDEFSSSGDLVYTGSGGKAAGTDLDGDQKLQRGNLALKNCIKREIPVRVTRGFKSQNREEGSHSIGKEISKFIYIGLYHVVGCWLEGIPGSRVFKYRLRRIPGQSELPLHVAKWLQKSARS